MEPELYEKILPQLKLLLPKEKHDKINELCSKAYRIGIPPYREIVIDLEEEETPAVGFLEISGNLYNTYAGKELEWIKINGEKI